MLILVLRDRSSDDEVDDVCVPRGVTRDDKELLIWKCVTDVFSSRDVETIPISGLPLSFRCPSCLLSPSQILEGAAPIVLVLVWPLSWRASILKPHDQCR